MSFINMGSYLKITLEPSECQNEFGAEENLAQRSFFGLQILEDWFQNKINSDLIPQGFKELSKDFLTRDCYQIIGKVHPI